MFVGDNDIIHTKILFVGDNDITQKVLCRSIFFVCDIIINHKKYVLHSSMEPPPHPRPGPFWPQIFTGCHGSRFGVERELDGVNDSHSLLGSCKALLGASGGLQERAHGAQD